MIERASQTIDELVALLGAIEIDNPLVAGALGIAALLVAFIAARMVRSIGRTVEAKISGWEGTRVRALRWQQQEILSADEIVGLLAMVVRAVRFLLATLLWIVATVVVLALIPWTRELAAQGIDLGLSTASIALKAVVGYIPNLALVVVIAALAWYIVRLAQLIFNGIETERIRLRGFYPEWAQPTFSILRVLIYIFALIVVFPYLPGAGSPAFRGVSIFFGVLFSLGSTSAVANVVAGVVITYMRPFKIGDRVKISDQIGIIIERSSFVTRLRTPKNVEIAIPNSMVLANHIVNYSAMAKSKGLVLHTTVTIGYDVNWRTVHELLVAAALATSGVQEDPPPFVHQKALGDYSVEYEVNASIRQPHLANRITSELHANILDRFHEAGVEIMSPAFTALRSGRDKAIPSDPLD